jgi:hypothetical protein
MNTSGAFGSVSTIDGLLVRRAGGLKPERQKERAETKGLALPFQLERNFSGEGNRGQIIVVVSKKMFRQANCKSLFF